MLTKASLGIEATEKQCKLKFEIFLLQNRSLVWQGSCCKVFIWWNRNTAFVTLLARFLDYLLTISCVSSHSIFSEKIRITSDISKVCIVIELSMNSSRFHKIRGTPQIVCGRLYWKATFHDEIDKRGDRNWYATTCQIENFIGPVGRFVWIGYGTISWGAYLWSPVPQRAPNLGSEFFVKLDAF